MVGGQPNSTVVALDPATGQTLWESVGKADWQGARTIGWQSEVPYHWTGEEKLASYHRAVKAGERKAARHFAQAAVAARRHSRANKSTCLANLR